jgi:hypothetical protein
MCSILSMLILDRCCWLLLAAAGCCCCLLLLLAAACCCWLLLVAAAAGCCCWLLLLAAGGCCLLLLAAAAAIQSLPQSLRPLQGAGGTGRKPLRYILYIYKILMARAALRRSNLDPCAHGLVRCACVCWLTCAALARTHFLALC